MWHIDQGKHMPAVDFVGDKCILTFTQMPTPEGLDIIIEVTEAAIKHAGRDLVVEVRLPTEYYAEA